VGNFFDETAGKPREEERLKERATERSETKTLVSTELASRTKDMNLFGMKDEKILDKIRKDISGIIQRADTDMPRFEQEILIEEMLLEITSLGKLHSLMEDATVSEVMVNGVDEVWVERKGKLELTDIKFKDNDEVLDLARKIVGHVGRRVDNSSPIVDARLPDGSRVHVVIPPIAMKGVTITIRKFFKEKLGVKDLVKYGTVSLYAAKFLEAAVVARANIVISGGTGSGKTTTLNIMSNFIPNDERIVTIEDSAELQLTAEHVVKLESRPANAEGKGDISIRDLIKASLRMRPERVVVGEVRDGSCYDLMQAMNTGHDGSMGTVHSNNPSACIARMENLILQAGLDLPAKFIRQLIVDAVDLVVQISRLKDGSRKITHISEVVGYDTKEEKVIVENIFEWRMTGFDKNKKLTGDFVYTGYVPTKELLEKFEKYGLDFYDYVKPEGV
jgi:pilus assembly protein CpaF